MLSNTWFYIDSTDASAKRHNGAVAFPNPFSVKAAINIQLVPHSEARYLSFKVYDVLGRNIDVSHKLDMTKNGVEIQIERGGLPNGIYFYKVESNNKSVASGKIMVQD